MIFSPVVLALVFLDELLAVVALGYWGAAHDGALGWVLAAVASVAAVVMWALFASPKATYGGPVARPVVKALVFGAATAGLWAAGHPGPAIALLVFSVAVNGLAQLPVVRATASDLEA
ncbi:MAG: YrdB family protein [Nocardioides sp.]